VRVQVPPYLDHFLAHGLDAGEDVGDQQLMTHPAIVTSGDGVRREVSTPVTDRDDHGR
jgi:hypothetical protein